MAKRSAPEVNAGSMADIAFLLLIFFLVTTTIEKDSGINRKLPPMEEIDPPIIKQKNIFAVLLNGKDQLLVEEELMEVADLRAAAVEFLDNNGDSDHVMFNTLGMTGYWTKEDNLKHNNVSFVFSNYSMHFNDYRNFGNIIFCDRNNLEKKLKDLGPDLLAIDKTLTGINANKLGLELFKKRLERKRKDTMIASALLDQKVASGCGNYIRAEVLYLAKISPFKEIGKLTNSEIELLWDLMRQLAFNNWNRNVGIKNDIINNKYKFAEYYNRNFLVYMQSEDINGKPVLKEKLNGRTIHYVK